MNHCSHIILIICFLLGAFSPSFAQDTLYIFHQSYLSSPQEIQDLLKEAKFSIRTDSAKSIQATKKALQIAKKPSEQAQCLFQLALTHHNWGQREKALTYLEEAYTLVKDQKLASLEGAILLLFAQISFHNNQHVKALNYCYMAEELWKKDFEILLYAEWAHVTSLIYEEMGLLEEALNIRAVTLPKLEEARYIRGIHSAYFGLASIAWKLERYKEAEMYYQKLLKFYEKDNTPLFIAMIYMNLGFLMIDKSSLDSAQTQLKAALEIAEEHRLGNVQGIARLGLGRIANQQKDARKALRLYQEAEPFLLTPSSFVDQLRCWYYRAQAYENLRKTDSTHYWIQQSYHTADSLALTELLQEILPYCIDFYSKQGNYQQAFQYQKDYYQISDSLSQTIQSQFTKFQEARKRQVLEKEAEMNDRIAKGSILIAVLLSLLVLLLIYIASKHYRMAQALRLQKDTINNTNQQLSQLNQNQVRLLSIISHDFKAPLSSLQVMIRLLQLGTLTQERQEQLLSKLEYKFHDTLSFLENILSWGRSQMKAIEVKPKQIELKKIGQKVVQLLSEQAGQKNVHLKLEIDELSVWADENMIESVLRNLVSNAIKFSPKGSEVILGSVEAERPTIFVKDSGVGISASQQALLFTKIGHSLDGTTGEKGTGLGLILCHDFMSRNNGEIWVESQVGKGSTFYLSFPPKADYS